MAVLVLKCSEFKDLFINFFYVAFTILALLAESHISFHTFPEKGIISFDFFTCGKVNPSVSLEIIKKELLSNNNMLIELPPLKSNVSFIKNNKSIFINSDNKTRCERFIERNGTDSIDIFHKMNEYQTDCLLIKSYCDIIIQNNKNKDIITDYFYKDIIKS